MAAGARLRARGMGRPGEGAGRGWAARRAGPQGERGGVCFCLFFFIFSVLALIPYYMYVFTNSLNKQKIDACSGMVQQPKNHF
jgi:hypothetical protein